MGRQAIQDKIASRYVVLDFKTDREAGTEFDRYRRQVAIYCRALRALTGHEAQGILMRI